MAAEILTPRCPLCDSVPYMVMGGGTQAFCPTDDCLVLTWDPSATVDENMQDMRPVQIRERDEEGDDDGPV